MAITIRETLDDPRRHHHHHKYTVNFQGTYIATTVTSAPSVVRKWLSSTLSLRPPGIRRRLVVGLGVQWNPDITPFEAATLQICIGRRCLIFQISRSNSVPLILRRFLLNHTYTFVGIWNHADETTLVRSRHELRLYRQPVDLRLHVRSRRTREGLARVSREEIMEEVLGYRFWFDRNVGMSEWDDVVLNEEQVLYATVDAHASFLIGKGLKAWMLSS